MALIILPKERGFGFQIEGREKVEGRVETPELFLLLALAVRPNRGVTEYAPIGHGRILGRGAKIFLASFSVYIVMSSKCILTGLYGKTVL